MQAADDDSFDDRLDISAVKVVRIARKSFPPQVWLLILGKQGHAVPRLTLPDRALSRVFDRFDRKLLLRRFQFLQTYDVGRRLSEPSKKNLETTVHPLTL